MSTIATHLTTVALPWRADAAEHWFSALNTLPWAMLLHSGYANHAGSRFDILTAQPCVTLRTTGTTTRIDYADPRKAPVSTLDDPLKRLADVMTEQNVTAAQTDDLPFQGGAIGLFGYDLGRRFETLPTLAAADIPIEDMAVGIYDWALIVDNQLKRVTLVSQRDAGARLAWLNALPRIKHAPLRLTTAWQSNLSRAQYGEKFRRVQAYLLSGDCYQVNLAQRFSAGYQGDEWPAFVKLNADNRAPFSAFLRLPEGAILSLSPERFIRLTHGEIQTRPIKGTLPRLSDPDADTRQAQRLASSPKDRAENLMIVDLLRNDVGRVAQPGSVRVPELFAVEPFAAVHHLVSTITARLADGLHATDLLRAAFPGGSITGAPKVRAMEIIEELEPQRRNAWCGSIGYISFCGRMDTNITIRTLIACGGRLHCSAGGGIVADSIEEAEYQETFAKVNRILRLTEQ
ncbi:aminodeoxychorismate synthase component 1 [Tenebrionicola larvae]|jgi:para-aminobenzoate synthetase component 1|uniref:Aminodeoxychorismate synthase component 1 n=1 Tax=Tenebrionicola larvae TaxID=2815733 RepID=A0A949Q0N9_9ENTR|nr:aminodeoxychorismate synthase component 1 [Tenebrionicola larvae]MBV5094719.1 aminodeoxychorismate synthase component 1 [Tenebrionicola larvae]